MTTITKPFNNTTTNTNTNTSYKKTVTSNSEKNLWCRDVIWKVIVDDFGFSPFKETNGCRLHSCNRAPYECRGAHNITELKPFKHIQMFNHLDKATYNWSSLFFEIISSLQKDRSRVKSNEHKRILANVSTMNFFEVIRTWREMACYYRKLAKELPSRKSVKKYDSGSTEFNYAEDVPKFYLSSDIEDTVWSMERLTRLCPEHQKFKLSIKSKQLVTIWDICLATGMNCKDGVHEINEKICEEDFLYGKCSCQLIEHFNTKQDELVANILDVSNKIIEFINHESEIKEVTHSSDRKSKKAQQNVDPKIKLTCQLNQYKKELEHMCKSRLIHYSDFGMVSFEIQYQKWIKEKKEKDTISKAVVKESWDHGLIDNYKITKQVVKISKFGTKK
jgi:hypothetical protein